MARYNEERADKFLNELCGWNDDAHEVFDDFLYRYFDCDEDEELTDERVYDCLDDCLCYYDDQWAIYRLYNAYPGELNWVETLEQLFNDIFDLIEEVKEGGEN